MILQPKSRARRCKAMYINPGSPRAQRTNIICPVIWFDSRKGLCKAKKTISEKLASGPAILARSNELEARHGYALHLLHRNKVTIVHYYFACQEISLIVYQVLHISQDYATPPLCVNSDAFIRNCSQLATIYMPGSVQQHSYLDGL